MEFLGPSAIVFTVTAVAVVFLVRLLRRRTRARMRTESIEATEFARNAAISLVRADDLVQQSTDELGFAIAQFGENATRDFAAALATSRRQLSEAFALQQKLDDGVPDTAAEIRRWNEQIRSKADEATKRLREQTHDFDSKRGAERDAPTRLEQLLRKIDRVADRVESGAATLTRLGLSYSAHALAPISGNVERARAALREARTETDATSARLNDGAAAPVGEHVQAAEHAVFRATSQLDAIEVGEDELHRGYSALVRAMDAAADELTEARSLRDGHEESEAGAELNRVIAEADRVLAELRRTDRLSDPAVDLAALRTSMDGLDIIRSAARNRQLRLDNARIALAGALLTANSQLAVTREVVTANRQRVGAAARTRLAEAERQLSIAEAEADPVAALDAARRAMTHATDADALARFDSLSR